MFEPIDGVKEVTGTGENYLCCGDGSAPCVLLSERAGQAQAVYLDPPFMTGETFQRRRRFGTQGWRKGSPCATFPSYVDSSEDREAYLAMLRGLIENAWLLLGASGMLCLHLDWRASARARLICDEVFGEERFVNEIVWSYESGGRARRYFSRKHDVILLYAKSRAYRFNLERVPLNRSDNRRNHLRRGVDEDGRAYRAIRSGGKEYRYYDDDPVYPSDVWTDISHLQQRDPERTGFPTQKPQKLLERLLRPLVETGDLVCDLCCGSGTALAVAERLGGRYLGMDASPEALHMAQARLDGANLCLQTPSVVDDVPLLGGYDAESGLLTVAGLPVRHPSFPAYEDALEPLERWSCGFLQPDGALRVLKCYQRTSRQPALPPMAVLPLGGETPVVSTVDAAGVRRVYRWRAE